MKALDYINEALIARGKSRLWLSKQMGLTPQNLSRKLLNNTITTREFLSALSHLGYEIKLIESEASELTTTRKRGVGPRVRQMIDGVIYDTFKAEALCYTTPRDGWFMELYKDDNGRHFVAHYTEWESGTNHISLCGEADAMGLCEKYGKEGSNE